MSVLELRPALRPSAPRRPAAVDAWTGVVVGLITLGALLLRVSQIDQSLFGDELWTFQQIEHHSLGQTLAAIRPGPENAPPLYFILAWASSKLGDPSVLIRLPSLILGVATIPIVYGIGRQTLGRAAGVVGAAVLAVSPFSVFYGIEARPYATMAFFVAVSTLAALRAVKTRSSWWWAVYVLAADAAAYSHYTAVFALAVQGVWVLWRCRHRPRQALIASAVAIVLYLPWVPHLASQELGIIGALHALTVHNIRNDLLQFVAGYPLAPLHAIPTAAGLVAIGVCALLGLGFLALRARARATAAPLEAVSSGAPAPAGEPPRPWGLVTALAIATPLGVLLYSLASTDIWDPRDLYASAPALALLLAGLVLAIPRRISLVAIAVLLGVLAFGTARAISPAWSRPPFRVAAAYLDHVASPLDPVVMYPSFLDLDRVIVAQLRERHEVIYGTPRRWPTPPPGGAVYVVRDDMFDAGRHIPVAHPTGFRLVATRRYAGTLPVTIFTYRRRESGA